MGLFDPISTAETGVNVSQTWLDAISENIANMDDVAPTSEGVYQTRFVVAGTIPGGIEGTGPGAQVEASIGGGTQVLGVALGNPDGVEEYQPNNPLADKQGMVRVADVNLGDQMSDMMMAQQGFEANLATVSQAEQAYQAALGLKV
ncbi:MAG TPA: flagellar basal body rod C-terminal domain-containing protein [Acidimicrobiales bacterium]|nr:flagellar basal body rod C-terminal domain-containing protein [Acidimicrobiales bacterium]